jgi:hypothetical protein
MVESFVKSVVLFSHTLLTLTFLMAWHSPFKFHLGMALTSVLCGLFANLCIIFYFVGTAVWMRDQAKLLYTRSQSHGTRAWSCFEKANKLKGKAFPFATVALVLLMFTFILGAALQVAAIPHWIHPTLGAIVVFLSWYGIKPTFRAMDVNLTYLDIVSDEVNLPATDAQKT